MRSAWLCTLGLAMLSPSLVVGLDLAWSAHCARAPLSWYLGAGAMGGVIGVLFGRKLSGDGALRKAGRRLTAVAVIAGALGFAWLVVMPPHWDAKCAYRYCGRTLGPGLHRSPFTVGSPSCETLHMCANEYPFSNDETRQLEDLVRERGCAPL